MGTRGSLWITDSQNEKVEGDSFIYGREGSIEVLSLGHKVTLPADMKTGKITGNRTHTPLTIVKKIDESTPFLHKACCTGECLIEARVDLYRTNQVGEEECYFTYLLSNVRVAGINTLIGGTEDNYAQDKERIALIYESITWAHHEGNHEYTDTWLSRS